MKKKSYCILFVVVLCAAILGTGIVFAGDIVKIDIRIAPNTLNLGNAGGKCVTVHAGIAYTVVDDEKPLELRRADDEGGDSVVAYCSFDDDRGNLVAKFNREEVAGIVDAGEEVSLTLTGKKTDGNPFTGSDTIRVIDCGGGK